MALKRGLHEQALLLIHLRYEARILADQIRGVWEGETVHITKERLERVREYSAIGSVAAWEDPDTYFNLPLPKVDDDLLFAKGVVPEP